jgi:hypothetical protein
MIDGVKPADLETLSRGHCPICNGRGFVLGPQGGGSLNIECANLECRARFNVANYSGRIVMAQRIPNPSEGGPSWPCV